MRNATTEQPSRGTERTPPRTAHQNTRIHQTITNISEFFRPRIRHQSPSTTATINTTPIPAAISPPISSFFRPQSTRLPARATPNPTSNNKDQQQQQTPTSATSANNPTIRHTGNIDPSASDNKSKPSRTAATSEHGQHYRNSSINNRRHTIDSIGSSSYKRNATIDINARRHTTRDPPGSVATSARNLDGDVSVAFKYTQCRRKQTDCAISGKSEVK